MKPIHPDDGSYCPLWRKPCHKVCHTCRWWNLVIGKHPQTNADVSRWDCAIALLPMLQIETTKAQRETSATMDALRKEVREADAVVSGTLARVNDRIDMQARLGAPVQKLIEN